MPHAYDNIASGYHACCVLHPQSPRIHLRAAARQSRHIPRHRGDLMPAVASASPSAELPPWLCIFVRRCRPNKPKCWKEKKLKTRKSGSIVFKNARAIRRIRLAQNEYKVHVSPESRLNTKRILHCDDKEYFQPTTVHEQIANILIVCP